MMPVRFMKSCSILMILGASLIFGCESSRVTIEHGDPGPGPYERGRGRYEEPRGGPPPWAPAHGYRAKHQYRYYPDNEVYYDSGRGLYFYYSDGDWRVSASLPSRIRVRLDDYVTLEMDTDQPYKHHRSVQRRYPPGNP